jgi:hypothetical protein
MSNSEVTISSKLFLADLGGSEQVKKSKIEAGGKSLTIYNIYIVYILNVFFRVV